MGGSASFGCQKVLGFEKKKQQTNPESESLTTINHNALENIQSFTRDACYKSITFFVFKKKMQLIALKSYLACSCYYILLNFMNIFFVKKLGLMSSFGWKQSALFVMCFAYSIPSLEDS